MSNTTISDIFENVLNDDGLRRNYFLMYLDRFVYQTTDVEKGLNAEERKKAINSLISAFQYLGDLSADKMTPTDIVNVGDFVNEVAGITGFRKIQVSAGNYAEWEPELPRNLYYRIYSLINNYYNVWTYRDIYEKEAEFHIEFMRIHPFEDGNKRVAKILMNSNLIKQNHPPVIITEADTLQYYTFINNRDVEGFAKFLKERSLQELHIMMSIYKTANNIPITDSVIDALEMESGGRK